MTSSVAVEHTLENSDEEDTSDLYLFDAADENCMAFSYVWNSEWSIKQFLERETYLRVRGTVLSNVHDVMELDVQSDIDGVTIEWNDLGVGLDLPFRHLCLIPNPAVCIRTMFSVIKKHIALHDFTQNSLSVLRECVGTQIIYEGQWETWLGFIPHCKERLNYTYTMQRRLALRFLDRVREAFQNELKQLLKDGIALDTLAKNNLSDLRKTLVLPGDRNAVLKAFQRALDITELTELPNFTKLLLSFRFGDKCRSAVILPISSHLGVKQICVHAGHTLRCDFLDIFWCRQGLQEVTGDRGCISSAMSFAECANFQSNLDGRRLDISSTLSSICTTTRENLRFVQLYSDIPHRYPNTRVHPVTGAVLTLEGLSREAALASMYADALTYMSEIENNFYQIKRGVCRLEFVMSIDTSVKQVEGSQFIRRDKLEEMLSAHPMLVPFWKTTDVMGALRSVGLYLHKRLLDAYKFKRGHADKNVVWEVFQTELAVEKLLWGRPLCNSSRIYSINLGPGVEYMSRSLTDQNGFLCIENSFSCCTDENTLPPLQIFSKNPTVQAQLRTVSGICNAIGDSITSVLGVKVMLSLLRDCHAMGPVLTTFENFVLQLKSSAGNGRKRLVGGITLDDLASKLSSVKATKWPMVFGAVKNLLVKEKVDVKEVVKCGVESLALGYFPALRTYDESRNEKCTWRFSYGYWVLTDIPDHETDLEREAGLLHSMILVEMEKHRVCHTSKYKNDVFQWTKVVLQKIKEKNLSVTDKVKVLAFLSGVALRSQGEYVNFRSFNSMLKYLPLSQSTLRMIEVQCRFELSGVHTVRVYRLHPSIPHKLEKKQQTTTTTELTEAPQTHLSPPEPSQEEEPVRIDRDIIIQSQETIRAPVSIGHNRANYGVWTSAELAIVADVASIQGVTQYQKYRDYQSHCRDLKIPDRPLAAFRCKLMRITKAHY